MKKSEFKKILKPIVQECIRESLLEEGLISNIISEVVKGMARRPIVGTKAPIINQEPADPIAERMKQNAFGNKQSVKLQEQKRKLMEAIGGSSYNGVDLFEGTTPAPAQGSMGSVASPLSGQDPEDAGVDISRLFGGAKNHWNAHMNEIKERK